MNLNGSVQIGLRPLLSFMSYGARSFQHIDDCLSYLTEDHSHLERQTAILLMSRLSFADYILCIRKLIL